MSKRKAEKDERIVNLENKINSNAFGIAIGLFVISLVFKSIFYRNPTVWADSMIYIDALIFVIPAIFVFICNILMGNDNFAYSKKHIVTSVLGGFLIAILIVLLSSHPNWHIIAQRALLGFVAGAAGLNLIYYALGKVSGKAAQKRDEAIIRECNNE